MALWKQNTAVSIVALKKDGCWEDVGLQRMFCNRVTEALTSFLKYLIEFSQLCLRHLTFNDCHCSRLRGHVDGQRSPARVREHGQRSVAQNVTHIYQFPGEL
jgi:hypothetical protein